MEVNKINGITHLNFGSRSRKNVKSAVSNQVSSDLPASKNATNALKSLLYAAMALGATSGAVSCKSDIGRILDTITIPTYYQPLNNDEITDNTIVSWNDTNIVKKPEYYTDTVYDKKIDPNTGENTFVPRYVTKMREVADTTITPHNSTLISKFKPVGVDQAAWDISKQLVNQGITLGIPVQGPTYASNSKNKVLLFALKAYNETNHKLYETTIDSSDTSPAILTYYTRITNLNEKDDNKKYSYMKTMIFGLDNQGLRVERFVKGEAEKNSDCDCQNMPETAWNYAGGETRINNNDGTITVIVADKLGNPINGEYGHIVKGNDLGSFLFGSYVYENNGCVSCPKNTPKKVNYHFSQAKMYTSELEGITK